MDLQNSDAIVFMGSNMAECHPCGFKWPMKAKAKGATLIHVDPRFTRTSAMCDQYVPIRSGTDIAFLGGLINYILTNKKYFEEYVVAFTNAATLINTGFKDTEENDGFFSGYNAQNRTYDRTTWQYQTTKAPVRLPEPPAGGAPGQGKEGGVGTSGPLISGSVKGANFAALIANRLPGVPLQDKTLTDPNTVFQILKKHYARYTPEMVEKICGTPKELFIKVAETLIANSGRDKTSAFVYAVGWTQHTVGVQYIRTAAIIQLLLGNIGRPGGGIMALRGHASIQGSTDIPTLFDLLPGYIPMPKAAHDRTWDEYMKNNGATSGWWVEFPKYMVSLLKAWFGEHASAENDWGYGYLPRLTGDHSHMTTVADMADGGVKGYFMMGENPTVGSMHGALHRKAQRELDWLVVRDFIVTETADFWRTAPEIERGEVRPEDIKTEVFFFPCAAHTEKDGSFTNTQRLLQWHHKAVESPGDCRSDVNFVYHLGKRLKELYAGSTDAKDRPIQQVTWDYPTTGPTEEPDAETILKEINGFTVANGAPVSGYLDFKDDGSTACGVWIYSGCYADGVNQAARRKPGREQTWVAPEWGWAWPSNRRIMYNRASADPDGKPWSERKKYVWWDEAEHKWTGEDVPDFIPDREPSYRPADDAQGLDTISGIDPFVRQTDGKGWLFVPSGLLDGPLPTHYEPQESVVENLLYGQQCSPARVEYRRKDNPYHRAFGDERFPYAITTYRLTEHH
ncbi:MAG TPA: formate dehydrogenase, partial [Actinobacteria bacterium]|nr:formate dehydrogenase [Actinomycetota bacterium]